MEELCFGYEEQIDWEVGLPVYMGTDEYEPPPLIEWEDE